jgi:hypothetical protein
MDKMDQFTITGVENVLEFITEIHNEVLKDDEVWHFFDEAEEGIFLRCSTKFSDKLNAFLKNIMGYDFTWKSYEEDMPVSAKFSWYFQGIFHLNSLMAIDFYNDITLTFIDDIEPRHKAISLSAWVGGIVERLSHSFLNNLQEYTYTYRKISESRFGHDRAWESFVIAETLIDRSMWTGMREAYLDAKNRKGKDDIK